MSRITFLYLHLLLFQAGLQFSLSFSPSNLRVNNRDFLTSINVKQIDKQFRLRNKQNDYIDAEFYTNDDDNRNKVESKTVTQGKKISPLQASLKSVEPKLSSLAFNFIDPSLRSASKQSFIPCRIAFIVNYNNIEYCLGTPVDSQVAIYVEDTKDNTACFLDPDEDDNIEIMERAASVFEMKYNKISLSDYDDDVMDGEQLRIRFKRTPRTLTVEGDLSIITGNWKEDGKKKVEAVKDVTKDILEEPDVGADDKFFDEFFTKELGGDYKEQALANNELDETEVEEMMQLFSIPGLGTEHDDEDGIQDLINEMENDEILAKGGVGIKNSETALRLVGFSEESDNGKIYSLVQLLQPMILVAKTDQSLDFDEKMLLTQEEAKEIVPMLEQQFKEQFEEAGISLR